jgi:hypothetical protein
MAGEDYEEEARWRGEEMVHKMEKRGVPLFFSAYLIENTSDTFIL